MKWACNHTWEYTKVAEYQCGHTFILCKNDFHAFPKCPIHVAAHLKPHSSAAGRIEHYDYDPDDSTTFFPAEDLEKQRKQPKRKWRENLDIIMKTILVCSPRFAMLAVEQIYTVTEMLK